MAIIAMIDDKINESFLQKKVIRKKYRIQNSIIMEQEDEKEQFRELSHSTISAKILEIMADEFEIINIQILKDPKIKGKIDDLAIALKECIKMKVDIICMSLGTVRLYDSLKLKDIIDELVKQNKILIAAVSNEDLITLPAFYKNVIGVRCDIIDIMNPGEIMVNMDDLLGGQVYGNCSFDLEKEGITFNPSNSFSVPVVASYVNEFMNKNFLERTKGDNGCKSGNQEVKASVLDCVINELKKVSRKRTKEMTNFLKEKRAMIKEEVPKLCFVGFKEETQFFLDLLDNLQHLHNVEGIFIDKTATSADIRVFSYIDCKGSLGKCIQFVGKSARIDLMVIKLNEIEYKENRDIFVENLVIIKNGQRITFQEGETKLFSVSDKEVAGIDYYTNKIVEIIS